MLTYVILPMHPPSLQPPCLTALDCVAQLRNCSAALTSAGTGIEVPAYLYLQVADSKDMLSMSDEGTGGTFVNTHGYVSFSFVLAELVVVVSRQALGATIISSYVRPGACLLMCACTKPGKHAMLEVTVTCQLCKATLATLHCPALLAATCRTQVGQCGCDRCHGPMLDASMHFSLCSPCVC